MKGDDWSWKPPHEEHREHTNRKSKTESLQVEIQDLVGRLAFSSYGPKGSSWSKAELALLGVQWPPRKGWKSHLLINVLPYQYPDLYELVLEKRQEVDPEPVDKRMPKSGYLYRSTRSGRYHVIVNNRTLCRRSANWKKQVVGREPPEGMTLCAQCEAMQTEDPDNGREATPRLSGVQNKEFYRSWEWKEARYETLRRYGPKCMLCGSEYMPVVDHIKPRSKYPELELDLDNLQVLCNECNMGKSDRDETDFRPKDGALSHSELGELHLVTDAKKRL